MNAGEALGRFAQTKELLVYSQKSEPQTPLSTESSGNKAGMTSRAFRLSRLQSGSGKIQWFWMNLDKSSFISEINSPMSKP